MGPHTVDNYASSMRDQEHHQLLTWHCLVSRCVGPVVPPVAGRVGSHISEPFSPVRRGGWGLGAYLPAGRLRGM